VYRPRTAGHPGSLPSSLKTSSEGNTITDRHIQQTKRTYKIVTLTSGFADPSFDDDDDNDDAADDCNDDNGMMMTNVMIHSFKHSLTYLLTHSLTHLLHDGTKHQKPCMEISFITIIA